MSPDADLNRSRPPRRLGPIAWLCGLVITLMGLGAARSGAREPSPRPVDVWLDVDPANGFGEVDDGWTMIQAFHSPEVTVRGVSVVYGNAPLRYALPTTQNIVAAFGPQGLAVHGGAAGAEDLGRETEAVRAMAEALRRGRLTILALGPVTNVGTLLRRYPDLADRIEAVVVVAGRRPGQRFITTEQSRRSFPPDFNFESDVPAMRILLESDVELVLAPWEVSSKVWVTRGDVASLRETGPTGVYLHATTQHWLARWERRRGVAAFNPYDTLALGWVTHPQLIEGERVRAVIEHGPDEHADEDAASAGQSKAYLHVRPADAPDAAGREAIYLHTPDARFKDVLLSRVAAPPRP